jgi:Domain of unknown function (DUF4252)
MNARVAFCIAALLLTGPVFAQSSGAAPDKGQLRIPSFAALTDKASESVNVTFGPELLGMACRFLGTDDPEEAAAKKLCTSLTGIYVRNYKFDTDYAYPKADIDAVRRQLAGPGWTQMVQTRNKTDQTDVDVYVLIEGGKSHGLAIIASQPREFSIVNIVGSIDLEQLHDLQKLGVPNLHIETDKRPVPAKAEAAKK